MSVKVNLIDAPLPGRARTGTRSVNPGGYGNQDFDRARAPRRGRILTVQGVLAGKQSPIPSTVTDNGVLTAYPTKGCAALCESGPDWNA